MNYPLDFYTQYHQFYLGDKTAPRETGFEEFWSADAHHDRLAMEDGTLGIGIECYGPVKGELIVLDKGRDEIDYDQYDHIVEGGLMIRSGILQVLDCPNSQVELELTVTPGYYRVRVYSSNLASVDGADEGDDVYQIEIWPSLNRERKVLKQYEWDNSAL